VLINTSSYSIAYLAEVVGPAGTYTPALTVQATSPAGDPVSVAPTITILEPTITLTNLPARENRVYKNNDTWTFGMEVTNASQVSFSGDGFTHGYENNTVTVTIACDGLASCLDGEKTLMITAGDKTQEVKFDVDNQAPTGTLEQTLSGPQSDYVTSVSGSATNERGGQAVFSLQ
ncbi:MAG: hypothetical protein PHU71_02105, partial [Candidatus Gracilibacteria bacterium]|nr:hypothetical protein [Candidatus Gracilibacteria bacterium]